MAHDPIAATDFDTVRGQAVREYGTVDTTQATFNTAIQEIEDWYNGIRDWKYHFGVGIERYEEYQALAHVA